MPVVSPTDVSRLQADVLRQYKLLDKSFIKCLNRGAFKNDNLIVSEWNAMGARVTAYTDESASWFDTAAQVDAGQQIQRDLGPWSDRLRSFGCDAPVAPAPPPAQGGLANLLADAKPIVILVVLYLLAREFRR